MLRCVRLAHCSNSLHFVIDAFAILPAVTCRLYVRMRMGNDVLTTGVGLFVVGGGSSCRNKNQRTKRRTGIYHATHAPS
jgi:hypothetical protein